MSRQSTQSAFITSLCARRDRHCPGDLNPALKKKVLFRRTASLAILALIVSLVTGANTLAAEADRIEVKPLDTILKNNPLAPDATGAIVEYIRAGGAEVGVLVMRKNRLHHHSHQDHVLFLVRGEAVAKLENAAGQVETRTIRPGDILSLPRGKKHGFEKSSDEDLVFLVVATALAPGVEETTYHE
jgi:mannose-6-phosphate isomerase-like protein (cupin superfamily)